MHRRKGARNTLLANGQRRIPSLRAQHKFTLDPRDDTLSDFQEKVYKAACQTHAGYVASLPDTAMVDEMLGEESSRAHHMADEIKVFHTGGYAVEVLDNSFVGRARDRLVRMSPNDVGRLEQGVANEISRLPVPGGSYSSVTFTGAHQAVMPRGDTAVSLTPDGDSEWAGYFAQESIICRNALTVHDRRLKHEGGPYIPNAPIAIINRSIPESVARGVVSAVRSILPLTVPIEPLTFNASVQGRGACH